VIKIFEVWTSSTTSVDASMHLLASVQCFLFQHRYNVFSGGAELLVSVKRYCC